LREKQADDKERRRQSTLQTLAVAAGIATAFLAKPAFPTADLLLLDSPWSVLALGLLASGGSGFWNAILSYVLQLKNLKKEQVQETRLRSQALRASLIKQSVAPIGPAYPATARSA